jgi:hypothetical protein
MENWELRWDHKPRSIDIIRMSFISIYRVIGPVLIFMSLLLMVWGGF